MKFPVIRLHPIWKFFNFTSAGLGRGTETGHTVGRTPRKTVPVVEPEDLESLTGRGELVPVGLAFSLNVSCNF